MRNLLLIFLLVFGLTACTSAPNEAEIKIQVAKVVLRDGGEKIFSFENFKKINGLMQEDGCYIAEVSYDLVFRKDLATISAEIGQQASESPIGAIESSFKLMAQLLQYGQFEAGDRLSYHKKFVLIKTEQGWRPESEFLNTGIRQ
ncbi:MAG: hypothetical protein BA874_13385 [Desulfuromonadales bacterium C00003068]|jgi:hypothetical protein|nr:MAG: hypothetical protein BA874_13385 [Desulfuromonadales bacterium C00003068]